MKTVQRSPSMTGLGACRASALNSSSTLTRKRPACSSRKAPVPAAQALFIAKSTTTPSRTADELAVLSADLEDGVDGGVKLDRGAGLGGDLGADDVGADEVGGQVATRAGGAYGAHGKRVAIAGGKFGADLGEAVAHNVERVALRAARSAGPGRAPARRGRRPWW